MYGGFPLEGSTQTLLQGYTIPRQECHPHRSDVQEVYTLRAQGFGMPSSFQTKIQRVPWSVSAHNNQSRFGELALICNGGA